MTDAQLTTILASIPIILTSIGSLWLAIRNRTETKAVAVKAENIASDLISTNRASTAIMNDVKHGVSEVHDLTNRNFSEQKAEIEAQRKEITELRRLLTEITTRVATTESLRKPPPLT